MCPLQSRERSVDIGEVFRNDRDIRDDKQTIAKAIARRANTVDITLLFRLFDIKLDEYHKKALCPFPFHQNERTGSFFYYKNTNSFYCFGCKSGGGPVNFISLMNGISKEEAADKIIERFEIDPDAIITENAENFAQKHDLILGFSTLIRTFIHNNLDDNAAIKHAEVITLIFDTINAKHNLDNDGIKSLVAKLKVKLNQYKG
jgi:DNA primase